MNTKSNKSKTSKSNYALLPAICLTVLGGCSGGAAQQGESVGSTDEAVVSPANFAPMALETKLGNPGKVLAVTGESTTPLATVVTWSDVNSPDQRWQLVDVGSGNFNILNQNSQQYMSVLNVSPQAGTPIVQWTYPDQSWHFEDQNDGFAKIVNNNTQKPFGIQNESLSAGAPALEWGRNATPDQEWRPIPKGNVRIRNVNSGFVMAVVGASTAQNINVVQYTDVGSADQSWQFVPNAGNDGNFFIRDLNSQKVLGLKDHVNAEAQPTAQWAPDGNVDELWRLRYESTTGRFRIQNVLSNKVLGVLNAATGPTGLSVNIVQTNDTGALDHVWEFLPDPKIDTRVSVETFQNTDINLCGVGHASPGSEIFISYYNVPGVNGTTRQLLNGDGVVADATGKYIWAHRAQVQGTGSRIFCTGAQSNGTVTVTATDTTTQLAAYDTIPAAFFCSNVGTPQAYHDGCNF